MAGFDLSDLGATPANQAPNYDLSDLGAAPIATQTQTHWYDYPAAFGRGVENSLASMVNRVGPTILSALSDQSLQPSQVPAVGNPAAEAQAQKTAPNTFAAGQFAGNTLPWLMPGVNDIKPVEAAASGIEGLLGASTKPVSNFLSNNIGGKIISNAGNVGLLSGAAAPFYSDEPASQSIPEGLLMGAVGGAAIPSALGLLGGAGRLVDVITASADKAKSEGSPYDAIRDEANASGFRTNPQQYKQTLESTLNQIGTQSKFAINKNLESDLYDRLDAAETEPQKLPNVFNVADTHAQLRELNNQIATHNRQGNYDAARIYGNLKDALQTDLLNSLNEQGLPHLANKFQEAQKNYAQNVVPLRDYPTSLGSSAKQLATLGLLSQLPESAETFGGVALGMHGKGNPLFNIGNRYASSYKGGPNAGLLAPQVALPFLNALGIPLFAGSANQ